MIIPYPSFWAIIINNDSHEAIAISCFSTSKLTHDICRARRGSDYTTRHFKKMAKRREVAAVTVIAELLKAPPTSLLVNFPPLPLRNCYYFYVTATLSWASCAYWTPDKTTGPKNTRCLQPLAKLALWLEAQWQQCAPSISSGGRIWTFVS